ncbi:MAG: c-type cytochrome [Gammaproteobacteria bacterium]|nr:c-type cytochrome [Gammaproteobacteria bacterium]
MVFQTLRIYQGLARTVVIGILLLGTALVVHGQEEESQEAVDVDAETVATPAVETSANELVATCVPCHGEDGNATIAGYPNLAGQNEKYLLHQMELMRSGERQIPLMMGQLEQKTDEELAEIASFYASLPGRIGQASPDLLELGEKIYRGGIMDKEVAACTACHSPFGNGNSLAGFPRISGQPTSYTIEALRQYREGERVSDENNGGMMRDVAARLTDTEIKAVANYISGLY